VSPPICQPPPDGDTVYRCACSWVGSDPDRYQNRNTCPACLFHDKRRIDVEIEPTYTLRKVQP